ncbi:hypothetical protein [Caballeronia sp. ATUFL_M2_KS44]|uniref:hypothetical protein n=1 Tax=Caballeronia sp. ATUFL_M2_KS44 TaxID=2921767 RepID=UPI002028E754|nr:hypothetical protein [Caballeronia sp. ATUFL_M2_KS44]
MKTCPKCKVTKPLNEFSMSRDRVDGRAAQCKTCANAAYRQWYARNAAKRREQIEAWKREHPENVRAHSARYRQAATRRDA